MSLFKVDAQKHCDYYVFYTCCFVNERLHGVLTCLYQCLLMISIFMHKLLCSSHYWFSVQFMFDISRYACIYYHKIFLVQLIVTPWRNGSASDSRSEGCVFESRRGQIILLHLFLKLILCIYTVRQTSTKTH